MTRPPHDKLSVSEERVKNVLNEELKAYPNRRELWLAICASGVIGNVLAASQSAAPTTAERALHVVLHLF